MRRLPDSELEIMLIIWNAADPVSRIYIQEHLQSSREIAPTTILSFLSRLEAKGFLKVEKRGKSNYYFPLIRQEDYVKNESKTMLARFFGNSLKNFVVQLSDSDMVEESELQELKKFLDRF
ncbi:MAG: BlaI/MecI/CopY family transcriptional regulator [Anaerovorax sp.]|nr:BlaI/MecI/CopY family transcriptional regulator [Anaerovorax sp.]